MDRGCKTLQMGSRGGHFLNKLRAANNRSGTRHNPDERLIQSIGDIGHDKKKKELQRPSKELVISYWRLQYTGKFPL